MEDNRRSRQDVQASIWFLEESEMYAKVKPYTLAFSPEAQIPRDNIQRKEESVPISDLRNSEQSFSLDHNGFIVLGFQNKHNEVEWGDEARVKDLHYPRVVAEVEHVLPEARCIALHHQVGPKRRGRIVACLLGPLYSSCDDDTFRSLTQREKTTHTANRSGRLTLVSCGN